MNALGDVWIPVVVSTFGASHGVVLTIVERLTIGYQKKAARTHISTIVTQCGLSRSRVSEVLEDLEAMGIIAVRDRARGRRPLVEIDPDWKPTPEKLELGNEKRRARRKAKHPEGNARLDSLKPEMSTPVDNSDVQPGKQEDVYPGGHLEQNEMSTPVDNEMSNPVDILKKDNKKAASSGLPVPLFSSEELGLESLDKKEKKEGNPTPPHSSSSSGKVMGRETRPTDDDYEEQLKRKFELAALGEDAPRETKGSEEELDGWQHLEGKAKTIPLRECGWESEYFAKDFAPRLRLERKAEKLKRVHEWILRQTGDDAYKEMALVAIRCRSELELGKVRDPWPYFMAAMTAEWNENIRHLPPPHTDEVLCARVEVEEIKHAIKVLRSLPGWPADSEREVTALVLDWLWNDEDGLFSEVLEGYERYVRRVGGLENAKIEGETAGALEHLDWFISCYPEYRRGMEYTWDGRIQGGVHDFTTRG